MRESLGERAWFLARHVARGWSQDNIASMGAALAFYTIFSLAPLLLMIVTIAGLAFGTHTAQHALLSEFDKLIGPNGAAAVRALLVSSRDVGSSLWSLAVSGVTLFIGATTVFTELQRDIDIIWRAHAPLAQSGGMWGLVKVRLLSFALIVGVGFLLAVSLAISAAIAALSTLWGDWLLRLEITLQAINFVLSTAVITALFALIYKLLPSTRIAWRDVWLGALVTSLLFALGKFAIGLYIGKSAIASSFGAAGAFIVIIVWVYFSAQIFLLGTRFTYVYACAYGSRCNLPSEFNCRR